ncbi:MAG TPA: hypothetical protein VNI20_05565 [Fimbriimonadaceae bacterium]|nr:hypothetical protein [Fimbriimonadaceae bacterium]
MKRLFLLLGLVVAGGVRADDLQLARQIMDGTMAELASHSDVWVVLSGTQTDGTTKTTFRYDLSIHHAPVNSRIVTWMELLDWQNGNLANRYAGDGTRFWTYNLGRKEYTSADYSTSLYPGKEQQRLFQNLLRRSQGPETFLARLMIDSYMKFSTGQGSAWMPWRPSAQVAVGPNTIVCSSTSPVSNTLTYGFKQVPSIGYVFTGAEYYEETVVSGKTRTTTWQVQVFQDQVRQGSIYTFVPPVGSHAIAVSEAGGTGG